MKIISKDKSIHSAILTSVLAILGIVIGNYLFQCNSDRSYFIKHNQELKEECYAKLSGLKTTLTQSITTYCEANVLSNYYYTKFHLISKDQDDFNRAIKQNDRTLQLIPEITKNQKELYEIIAKVKIAFKENQKLKILIDSLNDVKSIKIDQDDWFQRNIKTTDDLELMKSITEAQYTKLIDVEDRRRFNLVLPLLLEDIHKDE